MARILVIDAGVTELEAMRERLRADGHAVTTSTTAREGLARALAEQIDLVLVGRASDLSAFDFLRQLRASSPIASLPVIVIGAEGEEIDRVVAFELGADDYVVEPFSQRELALRVRAI